MFSLGNVLCPINGKRILMYAWHVLALGKGQTVMCLGLKLGAFYNFTKKNIKLQSAALAVVKANISDFQFWFILNFSNNMPIRFGLKGKQICQSASELDTQQ